MKITFVLWFILCLLISEQISGQTTQLTNLPTLYLTTDGGAIIGKENYVTGTLTVIAGEEITGKYNGVIEIKGRGNSTWFFPKKPYKIKLNSKTQLLGMPAKEKKWVLLANAKDNSLIRNALAFEISKLLGFSYTSAYRFVDVYLNGSYIGNYTLTDPMEVGTNRVEVEKLNNSITTEPDLSGGYLVQAEIYADEEPVHFRTTGGTAFGVKYPDEDDINSAQFDYIKNYVNQFESRLFSADFLDPVIGYRPMNHRESQVNWFIACELTANADSFSSIYFYKKRNDPKMYYGPLWDFDIAFNNSIVDFGDVQYKRITSFAPAEDIGRRMLNDPELRAAIKLKWNQIKSAGLEQNLNNIIDQLSQNVLQSQVPNKQKWGIYNPSNSNIVANQTYADVILELKSYLKKRIAYLDQQFNEDIRPDMYYKLANRTTNKVIDINNLTENKAVQKSMADGQISQQWFFIPESIEGVTYYKIKNRQTNGYLTAVNNNVLSTLKVLNLASNADTQLWKPTSTDNNIFFGFTNKANSKSIENISNSFDEGNSIVQNSSKIDIKEEQQWTFIPFEINSNPLPISLASFTANPIINGIQLNWNVVSSQNGSYFEIERSSDLKYAQSKIIGSVAIRDNEVGMYSFMDESPNIGTNYYRLKQVDLDETFEFSRYIIANYNQEQEVILYPQPSYNRTKISFYSQLKNNIGVVEIYNLLGQKVVSTSFKTIQGLNEIDINTMQLTPGLYNLKIVNGDHIFIKKMLIGQK